jgi:hypothetical protein
MANIREENSLIQQIAERAARMYKKYGRDVQSSYIESELRIVHFEIKPLHLKHLLEASDFNFMHDILGIHNHLDILDGSLKRFLPRFAVGGGMVEKENARDS